MTNSLKKALYSSLLFLLYAISMEVFLFIWFGWGFMPEYFLLDLGLMLFIAVIVFVVPKQWIRNIIICFFLAFQLVLSYVNICIMKNLSSAFVFDMLNLAKETAEVIEPAFIEFRPLGFYIPLVCIFVLTMVLLTRMKTLEKEDKAFSLKVKIYVLVIGILASFSLYSFEVGHITDEKDSTQSISTSSLFSTFYIGTTCLQKFGTYGFYFEDIFRRMFAINKEDVSGDEAKKQLLSKEYEVSDQLLYNKLNGDDLIVIMAESFEWYAISEQMTPVLFSLANGVDFSKLDIAGGEYFYSFTPNADGTYETERTNLNYEDLTSNEVGLSLVNYHSKAKTDYSEHSVVLGGYPFKNTYTNNPAMYGNTNYCYTLPSMFHAEGYETQYFHTWHNDFYNRNILNKRFGFDELTFIEDMDKMENYHGELLRQGSKDSAFMQLYYDEFVHKDYDGPFMSFFTSVSTHGPYEYDEILEDFYPIVDNSKHLKLTEDADVDYELWNGYVDTYLAGAVDLEYAVGYLIYNLAISGKLDSTAIVFYADHNCYANDADMIYKSLYYTDYYEEQMGEPYYWLEKSGASKTYDAADPNRYTVPAFIYSTKLTNDVLDNNSHYVKTFTEAYDLSATIMTLFGIDYLPGGYMGYPVYCKDLEGNPLSNHLIISQNSGVFSDRIYSEDGNTITYAWPGVTDEEKEEFKKDAAFFFEKWRRINAIYKYDLFYKVKNA